MDKKVSFSNLKKELSLSDGNLSSHLEKLEKKWYIKVQKSFVNKKPLSTISITQLWEKELIAYMNDMKNILNSIIDKSE